MLPHAFMRTSFFTASHQIRFSSSHRSFSQGLPMTPPFIKSIFAKFRYEARGLAHDKKMKIDLVEAIVTSEYEKALRRKKQTSHLFHLIQNAPKTLTPEARLRFVCDRLHEFPAMPVITAHPTRVLSNEILFQLYDTVDSALKLALGDLLAGERALLENKITTHLNQFIHQPMTPEKHLTPKEEADVALFIYQKIIGSFPDVYQAIEDEFIRVHGGEPEEISRILKPAVMFSFRHVHSWVKGDTDGNFQVSAQTMAETVPAQQVANIELYIKALDALISQLDAKSYQLTRMELQKTSAYLTRCINSISSGIWFDVAGSNETKKRITHTLDSLINKGIYPISAKKQLISLRDLIELTGFFGGLREFVRQTTKVNQDVFENLVNILVEHHEITRAFMTSHDGVQRSYSDLSVVEKTRLHERLSSNPDYFSTLKRHSDEFTALTRKELDRLLFISKHSDIFPSYIFSDTEDKINMDELLILLRFSTYLDGALRIGQMHQYPVNTLPLCETPNDLNHFPIILKAMLNDPYLRKKIVSGGFVSYVSGPSDLGKVGGIVVYLSLVRNQMEAEAILETYKTIYPELSATRLRVLHGFGGDMKRRFGSAQQQAHCTHQGWGAYDVLGAPGAYAAYLHGVVGYPCENDFKVEELRQLKIKHPDVFATFLAIEEKSINAFQTFIGASSSKDLLIALTDFNIEKKLNISSRAGSKKSATDITNIRAIGLLNLHLLTRVNWDIFMSVMAFPALADSEKAHLPLLFNQLTVMKDIVYKVLFSLAVSDLPRAWNKLTQNAVTDEELSRTLSFIEASAFDVMQSLVGCLPELQQARADVYFKANVNRRKPVHQVALELMDALGDEFSVLACETRELLPHFSRLSDCIDAYQLNPTRDTEENVVLACRGYQVSEGPRMISELMSPLHQQAIMLRGDPIIHPQGHSPHNHTPRVGK
jgi:hypothetical protein